MNEQSDLVKQTVELLEVLPQEDVLLVNKLVKKLILAWDPDFTKVSPQEAKRIEESDEEMKAGIYVTENDFISSVNPYEKKTFGVNIHALVDYAREKGIPMEKLTEKEVEKIR